jgi:hypothetical protein
VGQHIIINFSHNIIRQHRPKPSISGTTQSDISDIRQHRANPSIAAGETQSPCMLGQNLQRSIKFNVTALSPARPKLPQLDLMKIATANKKIMVHVFQTNFRSFLPTFVIYFIFGNPHFFSSRELQDH